MLARREVIADQVANQEREQEKLAQTPEAGQARQERANCSWEGDDKLNSEDDVVRIVKERKEKERGQEKLERTSSATSK